MNVIKPIQHIGYSLAYLPSEIIFRLLCSLKVDGRNKISITKNTLFVANHKTMIDSWLITCATFGLKVITNWNLTPYHPAAVENFLNTPLKRFIFGDFLKCIPVNRNTFDNSSLDSMITKLKSSTMITFPEGTRTRKNQMIPKAKPGVGYIIYNAKPNVIPVYHKGTEKVLPVGSTKLSFGHKLNVRIGESINFSQFYAMPNEKETWQKIADYTLKHLLELEKDIN